MEARSQLEKERIVIGVDLHPDSFAAAAFSGSNATDAKLLFQHTRQNCEIWEKWLKKYVPIGTIIVMEAGSNSFEFAKIAEKLGIKTVILESQAVGKIAKNICKTDLKDATKLVKVYLTGLAESIWQPDEITRVRREILSAYHRAVRDCTRTNNRIKCFLCGRKVRLKKGMRLKQKQAREYIWTVYNWSEEQKFLLREMFEDFDNARARRLKLHQQIGKTVLENPQMNQLMRLCGIRLISAYAIIAAIGDVNRFADPKKLVSYFGLAPSIKQSGNSFKRGGIKGGGRRTIKSILTQAAYSILKSKNESGQKLKEWALKLKARRHIHLAISAIARKLTVAIWYTLKGFAPEILDAEKELKTKLKKVTEELTEEFIKKLGYKNTREFRDKYLEIILSHKFLFEPSREK